MQIERANITNYKSFHSLSDIKFKSGFNIIIGRNDVGKTALVEALSCHFSDKPHLSEATMPTQGRPPSNAKSHAELTFSLSTDEIVELLRPEADIIVPIPNADVEGELRRFHQAFSNTPHMITVTFRPGDFVPAYLSSLEPIPPNVSTFVRFRVSPTGQLTRLTQGIESGHNPINSFPTNLAVPLRNRIFALKAERLNIGESGYSPDPTLSPDARNLAQVLNILQGNPSAFAKYNRFVSIVFPQIKQVTVAPADNGLACTSVWSVDPQSERTDLAIPLSESGTGVSQVLAILYVVLTANYPKVIIIDEPQSFLHPGAVRKLIDVLKRWFPQHQYIIATHSPMVISSAEPQAILLVRKENSESSVEAIDLNERQELELTFSEVGTRLSDVFGADYILWVEGRTEEECLPLILSSQPDPPPTWGVKILGVVSTGDFEGKHSRTILDIYRRLSGGKGIIPPAVGFIFDREGRSETLIHDIERQSKGAVHFLPRKMYENYLLDPQSISEVMSNIEGFRESPITKEEVSDWLSQHGSNDENWEANVNGAKILSDLFNDFSETRCAYDKIGHGIALTKRILLNKPEAFKEISDLLHNVLQNQADNS